MAARTTWLAAGLACLLGQAALASGIPVTPENYVEADVDLTFANISREVGSNAFRHDRSLIPLDQQIAVTVNRDTIYSFGVFYAPRGTTITLPRSRDGRYQSAMILQADHYVDQVFYAPGTFEIVSQTEFVAIGIRTQVNASDPADIAYVNSLQDQIAVRLPAGVNARTYVPRQWDMASLEALRTRYQEEARALPNLNATSGARGTIDPHMQRLGVAVALGLLPPQHAVYMYRDYGLRGDRCYEATYQVPRFGEGGFFSLTMYGADKYVHEERSSLNNRAIRTNPDGTFTMRYGPRAACGEAANWLNTPGDNWYLGMRVYRPAEYIVEGRYELPVPAPVSAR